MTSFDQAYQVLETLETAPGLLQDNWCVPRETGRFLHVLSLATNAQRILEIGTSIGYSTLWLALGARQTGGRVDTIEYYESRQEQAKTHLARAGLSDLVTFHLESALDALKRLAAEGRTFDFVFIDAAKKEYIDYVRLLTPMLTPGACLVADNTRSHRNDMRDFLDDMAQSDTFDIAELETPNGQLLARKRAAVG